MKSYLKLFVFLFLSLTYIYGVISWFEAEKEVHILCSMFPKGNNAGNLIKTLETGHYLQYQQIEHGDTQHIHFDSRTDLRNSGCNLVIKNNIIQSNTYSRQISLSGIAAWLTAAGFAGLIVFQLLLVFGLPLGYMAWGGKYKRLPPILRLGSLLSAALLLFGILCVLERAGIVYVLNWPSGVSIVAWLLTILFGLSTLANYKSKSKMERVVMTPLALLLCCLCFIVALTP